jgi:hypothetical protein
MAWAFPLATALMNASAPFSCALLGPALHAAGATQVRKARIKAVLRAI